VNNILLSIELATAFSNLSKKMDGTLSVHGISFTEYRLLYALVHSNDKAMIRRIDLAELLGLSASGVTRMILPMEKIGLVEKVADKRDARVSFVALSSAGKKIYEEATLSMEFSMEKFVAALKEDEVASMIASLEKL
jgi:DNA-binding MarR family transcriptional regulator